VLFRSPATAAGCAASRRRLRARRVAVRWAQWHATQLRENLTSVEASMRTDLHTALPVGLYTREQLLAYSPCGVSFGAASFCDVPCKFQTAHVEDVDVAATAVMEPSAAAFDQSNEDGAQHERLRKGLHAASCSGLPSAMTLSRMVPRTAEPGRAVVVAGKADRFQGPGTRHPLVHGFVPFPSLQEDNYEGAALPVLRTELVPHETANFQVSEVPGQVYQQFLWQLVQQQASYLRFQQAMVAAQQEQQHLLQQDHDHIVGLGRRLRHVETLLRTLTCRPP